MIDTKGFETAFKPRRGTYIERIKPEEIENKMFTDLKAQQELYLKRV